MVGMNGQWAHYSINAPNGAHVKLSIYNRKLMSDSLQSIDNWKLGFDCKWIELIIRMLDQTEFKLSYRLTGHVKLSIYNRKWRSDSLLSIDNWKLVSDYKKVEMIIRMLYQTID